jgi:hypothetical protein
VIGCLHTSSRWASDDGLWITATMAPADLLIGLLERVPMSEAQIARATLADSETIRLWLRRRQAPAGTEGQRLIELVAFVEEMARNVRAAALAEWLDRDSDFL